MKNSLFISPHNDDAVLFGAFTLMREKPVVLTVTRSFIQSSRGENITAIEREMEDVEAIKVLGCPIIFGDIRDDIIDVWCTRHLLSKFNNFDIVYAPAVQGGNKDHDLIGKMAKDIFGNRCKQYTTYTPTELYTTGSIEIVPTQAEMDKKNMALDCYRSQINLSATAPHFEAVRGRSEWIL